MRRIAIGLGGLLWSSCADVGTSAHDDDAPSRAVVAPFVFEPAFARLMLHDVVIDGHMLGDVAIEGAAIEAVAGRLDGVRARADEGAIVPLARHDDAQASTWASVDAELVDVELIGIDAARDEDGAALVLPEPLRVTASGFSWDDPGSQLVVFESSAGASASTSVQAHASLRRAPVLVRPELAHALAGDDAGIDALAELVPPPPPLALAMGEPCEDSPMCDDGLFCVVETKDDLEAPALCLPYCVPTTPSSAKCTDDVSCCDADAVCSDEGICVVPDQPSDDDGGGGGGGGGCGSSDCDDDDDQVVDAIDQNPDQSCSADADDDGCNDSCDRDDMDGGCSDGSGGSGNGFCSTGRRRLPRPNATAVAFVVLVMSRGRRRR